MDSLKVSVKHTDQNSNVSATQTNTHAQPLPPIKPAASLTKGTSLSDFFCRAPDEVLLAIMAHVPPQTLGYCLRMPNGPKPLTKTPTELTEKLNALASTPCVLQQSLMQLGLDILPAAIQQHAVSQAIRPELTHYATTEARLAQQLQYGPVAVDLQYKGCANDLFLTHGGTRLVVCESNILQVYDFVSRKKYLHAIDSYDEILVNNTGKYAMMFAKYKNGNDASRIYKLDNKKSPAKDLNYRCRLLSPNSQWAVGSLLTRLPNEARIFSLASSCGLDKDSVASCSAVVAPQITAHNTGEATTPASTQDDFPPESVGQRLANGIDFSRCQFSPDSNYLAIINFMDELSLFLLSSNCAQPWTLVGTMPDVYNASFFDANGGLIVFGRDSQQEINFIRTYQASDTLQFKNDLHYTIRHPDTGRIGPLISSEPLISNDYFAFSVYLEQHGDILRDENTISVRSYGGHFFALSPKHNACLSLNSCQQLQLFVLQTTWTTHTVFSNGRAVGRVPKVAFSQNGQRVALTHVVDAPGVNQRPREELLLFDVSCPGLASPP